MVLSVADDLGSSASSNVGDSGNPRRVKNGGDHYDESCLPVTLCLSTRASSSLTIHAHPLDPPSALENGAALILGRHRTPGAPSFCLFDLVMQEIYKGKGITGHLSFFDLKSIGTCQILIQIM